MKKSFKNKKVAILDSTLREGEQTPGVSFRVEEKLEIARRLDEIDVDIIEAGFPIVSPDIKDAVKRIVNERLNAEILGYSRAAIDDINEVISCDTDSIAIFLGTTTEKLKQLRKNEEEIIQMVVSAVEYARDHGLTVRFTAEDASRTDYRFLVKICSSAIEAGAERISIPDTVGIMTPRRTKLLFQRLSKVLNCYLETHNHNDLSLAVANSLAGWEGGAKTIHVTINGLGERSGISSLAEVTACLKVQYGINTVGLEKLLDLSTLVEKYSGIVVSQNASIVGENAFLHKAGTHVAAVLINPITYEAFPPELVGRHREIIISKYSGKHAVKAHLEELGIKLNNEQIKSIVSEIKSQPEINSFRDEDLIGLAEKISGNNYSATIPQTMEALTMIKCSSNVYTTSVARRVRAIRNVRDVFEITGESDIQTRIIANNTPELNECLEKIRSIKGVESICTNLIVKKFNGLIEPKLLKGVE